MHHPLEELCSSHRMVNLKDHYSQVLQVEGWVFDVNGINTPFANFETFWIDLPSNWQGSVVEKTAPESTLSSQKDNIR